tara:strand:- start:181 stop:444 length:264 start_codon:yes stop_codon:yes gene_type:complete
MLTPEERRLRAQIGAYSLHAKYDSRQITEKARAAFMSRFENEVDPERILPEEERTRRADKAKSAHFRKMALRSSKSRKARAAKQKKK